MIEYEAKYGATAIVSLSLENCIYGASTGADNVQSLRWNIFGI